MKYYIIKSSQETVNYVPNSIKYKYVKQNPRITKEMDKSTFIVNDYTYADKTKYWWKY